MTIDRVFILERRFQMMTRMIAVELSSEYVQYQRDPSRIKDDSVHSRVLEQGDFQRELSDILTSESIVSSDYIKRQSRNGKTTSLTQRYLGNIEVWDPKEYLNHIGQMGDYNSPRATFTKDYLEATGSYDFEQFKRYATSDPKIDSSYLDNALLGYANNLNRDAIAAEVDLPKVNIGPQMGSSKQPVILMSKNYSNKVKEIARSMGVSEKAVKTYVMWHEAIHAGQYDHVKSSECSAELGVDVSMSEFFKKARESGDSGLDLALYNEMNKLAEGHYYQYFDDCKDLDIKARSLDDAVGLYEATK